MTDSADSIGLTVGQIIERCRPLGNLHERLIDDLNEGDEELFSGILEDV